MRPHCLAQISGRMTRLSKHVSIGVSAVGPAFPGKTEKYLKTERITISGLDAQLPAIYE
jgi:hypothetical protein